MQTLSCQIPCRKCRYYQPPPLEKQISKLPSKIFTLGPPIWKSPLALGFEQWVGWLYSDEILATYVFSSLRICSSNQICKSFPFMDFLEWENQQVVSCFVSSENMAPWTSFGKTQGLVAPAGCFIHLPAATGHCRATSLRVFKSKIGSLEANFQLLTPHFMGLCFSFSKW